VILLSASFGAGSDDSGWMPLDEMGVEEKKRFGTREEVRGIWEESTGRIVGMMEGRMVILI